MFHLSKSLLAFGIIALLPTRSSLSQKTVTTPILSRDIDKSSLPQVSLTVLSPKMRIAIQELENEAKQDAGISGVLPAIVQQIPAAPSDHKLFLVHLSGEGACAPAGVNCTLAVFDEVQDRVVSVFYGQYADALVIRRPHLQMPDIGARYQLGHSGNDMTVYRYSRGGWHPYACKKTSITGYDDPHPEFVADAKCSSENRP